MEITRNDDPSVGMTRSTQDDKTEHGVHHAQHVGVSYIVENPTEEQATHLKINLKMGHSVNGIDGGLISVPWPAKGADLRSYARERVQAKLINDFGAAYTNELPVDLTPWPGVDRKTLSDTKDPGTPAPTPGSPAPQQPGPAINDQTDTPRRTAEVDKAETDKVAKRDAAFAKQPPRK